MADSKLPTMHRITPDFILLSCVISSMPFFKSQPGISLETIIFNNVTAIKLTHENKTQRFSIHRR